MDALRGIVTSWLPRARDKVLDVGVELLEWFPQEHARKTGVQLVGPALLRQLERVRSRSE